ncbi:helix-turn-helix domain-containing protein [Latilactobacillus curvatus]|uniref:helix-turn-helix domain-containing protein n=1 Tax=Latilactobacillus curvatus TaxID=28038 RepID=UPI002411248E|nr:helix-turn-helix transcriptional regulator [Latilactobacillus curvatus]MDG2984957.1 helix-turn-helix domain-containing protein [Latilactobacillus curvatus]
MPAIPDNLLAATMGRKLATVRRAQGLSQHQLAQDICSQPMISHIENGTYIPNAILLAKLCERLNMPLEQALLSHYPEIDQQPEFNQQIKQLCNAHDYRGMLDYLDATGLAEHLELATDLQTYYYYHGIAVFQELHTTTDSLRELQMALDYTFTPRQQVLTPTEILILSSISFIKSTPHTNQTDFEHVLAIVNAGRFTHYDENINILFYLYSLALYQDHHFQKAFAIANQGIDWLSNHDSHYMLADLFLLVACTIKKEPRQKIDFCRSSFLKFYMAHSTAIIIVQFLI